MRDTESDPHWRLWAPANVLLCIFMCTVLCIRGFNISQQCHSFGTKLHCDGTLYWCHCLVLPVLPQCTTAINFPGPHATRRAWNKVNYNIRTLHTRNLMKESSNHYTTHF